MIISHKYKFIFIKTYKTAGTSVEVYLSDHCGPMDVLTPIKPEVETHKPRNFEGFYNHIPGREIMGKVPAKMWDNYYKFTIERNPWDKTLSYYFMKKYRGNINLTLDEYLMMDEWPINYPKYCDNEETQVIVDKVIYYEDLNRGLSDVFKKLDVPFGGALNIFAKSNYRTDRRHYHEIYTKKQADLISNVFKTEISIHNYRY